jgi:malate dehydrogenase
MISAWDQVSAPKARHTIPRLTKPGVAADISHINTNSTVKGYDPTPSGLRECLTGAEIILIPAGVPRKPGMTRDGRIPSPALSRRLRLTILDLFNTNASIVRDLAKAAADAAPNANVLVISNPVRPNTQFLINQP